MSLPLGTASKLYLGAICPGSHALMWTRDTSAPAEVGKAGHAFLERAGNGDLDGALELLAEEIRARCEAINIRKVFGMFQPGLRTEVAFAFDIETGKARELGQALDRDYSDAKPTEFVGTADIVSRIRVGDHKFGRAFVDRPRDNWQFRFGAVCNAQVQKVDEQEGVLVKIDDEGGDMVVRDEFNVFALDGHASELVQIGRRIQGARADVAKGDRPELVVGDHCGYCPARWSCPAQAEAAQALVPISERVASLTPADAARAWVLLRGVQKIVDQMGDALRAYALDHVLQLPNGKVVREVPSRLEVIDAAKAVGAAPSVGLSGEKLLSECSITKAALERAFGKKDAAALLEELRRNGGVTFAIRNSMREVNP